MATRILKLTNTEAVVKIDGPVGTDTIDLDVDLLLPTEELSGAPVRVNIISMQVSGQPNSVLTVSRNSTSLWQLQAVSAEKIDLNELGGVADNTFNTSDIVVGRVAAEGQLILKLRKVSGFRTLIRPEQTGNDTV